MSKQAREPDSNHPIDVVDCPERITVTAGGVSLAESARAKVMYEAGCDPVAYIPRADVAMARLTPHAKRTHCPYKGKAVYYALNEDEPPVAWSYEAPYPWMAAIEGYLAFDPDAVDAIERQW